MECKESTKILIQELQGKFPNHELMLALGVIYPNFWASHPINVKNNFHQHMTIIKYTYYIFYTMGNDGMWMKSMLDGYVLDLQCSFYKMTMITNNKLVMKEKFDVNSIIRSWTKIRFSSILKHKLLKFMKLAKIARVHIFGSIEDEQCFKKRTFMKNKLKPPIWICAFNSMRNASTHFKTSLLERPSSNGQAQKHNIVLVHLLTSC